MTFSIADNAGNAAWHALVELTGSGSSTLYLSATQTVTRMIRRLTDPATPAVSRVWIALPIAIDPLESEYSDALLRRPRLGSVSMDIIDDDSGMLRAWYEEQGGAIGRRVSIWLSLDSDTSADLAFDGVVAESQDATYDYDAGLLHLDLMDRRINETCTLPREVFDPSDLKYEYVDENWKNRPIPILYGDWSAETCAIGSGLTRPLIEAVAIDTGFHRGVGQYGMGFKICGPGANGIAWLDDRVWIKYGNAYAYGGDEWSWMNITSSDLSTGEFEVDAAEIHSQTYRYQTGDKFYVYCKGNADEAGNVIENPLLIMRDLWNNYASPQTENADWPDLDTGYLNFRKCRGRACISEERDLIDLTDQLAAEFKMIWGVAPRDSGSGWDTCYWAELLNPWNTASQAAPAADYRPEWGNLSAEPETDPPATDNYADFYRVKYCRAPRKDRWVKIYEANVSGLRYLPWTPDGAAFAIREIESQWLFRKSDVRKFVDQQALLYAKRRMIWNLTAWGWPLTAQIGDAIEWQAEADANARRGIIVARSADLLTGECELRVLDCSDRVEYMGRWTADDEPVYDDQDSEGKRVWGFWTDENGYCSAGGPTTEDSHWN